MNSNAFYAYNYYLQRGYSPAAAAGIVGNLQVESGFSPDVISGARRGDSGSAFGVPQLRGTRLSNYLGYAKDNGLDYRSLDTQLGFVDHEMRNGLDDGAAQAYRALQSAQTPSQAAQSFMQFYERPNADPSVNAIAMRQQYANTLMGVPTDSLPTSYEGLASLAPEATAALPTVQEAATKDPMGGVFGLLLQSQMQQQPSMPVAAPAPVQRKPVDTRSEEEKLAAVSQTPNVYYDRIRRRATYG